MKDKGVRAWGLAEDGRESAVVSGECGMRLEGGYDALLLCF